MRKINKLFSSIGKQTFVLLSFVSLTLLSVGCSSTHNNSNATKAPLSSGGVKMYIDKGVTTQAEVIENFGPPDLLTHKDNMEIWTYDKTSYQMSSSEGRLSAILIEGSTSSRQSSSVSTMLILYFENEIVKDYRLSVVKF